MGGMVLAFSKMTIELSCDWLDGSFYCFFLFFLLLLFFSSLFSFSLFSSSSSSFFLVFQVVSL